MRINTQENEVGTVVGGNVRLQGTLKDTNDIIIHGTVEGEVISERTVNITESASVKGPVTADTVVVSGVINGAIDGKNKVEITTTGKVNGSITTSSLVIQAGAIFNGKSTMAQDTSHPKPSPTDESTKESLEKEPKTKNSTDFELE